MGSDRAKRKVRGGSLDMGWELKVRRKIQMSNVANQLIDFVEGHVKLEAAQVTAGLGLLKKALPDLAATEITGKNGAALVVEIIKPKG